MFPRHSSTTVFVLFRLFSKHKRQIWDVRSKQKCVDTRLKHLFVEDRSSYLHPHTHRLEIYDVLQRELTQTIYGELPGPRNRADWETLNNGAINSSTDQNGEVLDSATTAHLPAHRSDGRWESFFVLSSRFHVLGLFGENYCNRCWNFPLTKHKGNLVVQDARLSTFREDCGHPGLQWKWPNWQELRSVNETTVSLPTSCKWYLGVFDHVLADTSVSLLCGGRIILHASGFNEGVNDPTMHAATGLQRPWDPGARHGKSASVCIPFKFSCVRWSLTRAQFFFPGVQREMTTCGDFWFRPKDLTQCATRSWFLSICWPLSLVRETFKMADKRFPNVHESQCQNFPSIQDVKSTFPVSLPWTWHAHELFPSSEEKYWEDEGARMRTKQNKAECQHRLTRFDVTSKCRLKACEPKTTCGRTQDRADGVAQVVVGHSAREGNAHNSAHRIIKSYELLHFWNLVAHNRSDVLILGSTWMKCIIFAGQVDEFIVAFGCDEQYVCAHPHSGRKVNSAPQWGNCASQSSFQNTRRPLFFCGWSSNNLPSL